MSVPKSILDTDNSLFDRLTDEQSDGRAALAADVAEFLGVLRRLAPRSTEITEFRYYVSVFRKWKTILLANLGTLYPDDLDGHSPTFPHQSAQIKELTKAESVPFNPKIRLLTKAIDPFSEWTFDIERIDEAFYHRYNGLELCQKAMRAYRRSDFASAVKAVSRCIHRAHTKAEFDNIDKYTVAWALHILGSVAFAVERYDEATRLFSDSHDVKSHTRGLYQINLLSTQSKLIASRLMLGQVQPAMEELRDLFACLERDQAQLIKQNQLLYFNLRIDVGSRLALANIYAQHPKQAQRLIVEAEKLALEIGDISGAVWLAVFRGMSGARMDIVREMFRSAFASASASHLRSPAMRALLGEEAQGDMRLYRGEELAVFVKETVESRHVKPLDLREARLDVFGRSLAELGGTAGQTVPHQGEFPESVLDLDQL